MRYLIFGLLAFSLQTRAHEFAFQGKPVTSDELMIIGVRTAESRLGEVLNQNAYTMNALGETTYINIPNADHFTEIVFKVRDRCDVGVMKSLDGTWPSAQLAIPVELCHGAGQWITVNQRGLESDRFDPNDVAAKAAAIASLLAKVKGDFTPVPRDGPLGDHLKCAGECPKGKACTAIGLLLNYTRRSSFSLETEGTKKYYRLSMNEKGFFSLDCACK